MGHGVHPRLQDYLHALSQRKEKWLVQYAREEDYTDEDQTLKISSWRINEVGTSSITHSPSSLKLLAAWNVFFQKSNKIGLI